MGYDRRIRQESLWISSTAWQGANIERGNIMKNVNRISEACVLYSVERDVLGAVFSSAHNRITQKQTDGKQQVWYMDDLRRFPWDKKVLPETM